MASRTKNIQSKQLSNWQTGKLLVIGGADPTYTSLLGLQAYWAKIKAVERTIIATLLYVLIYNNFSNSFLNFKTNSLSSGCSHCHLSTSPRSFSYQKMRVCFTIDLITNFW